MGPNEDPFLDDFLLTHIVFMSVGQLVDELVNHYHNETDYRNGAENTADDYEYLLISKKRVVQFIQRWVTVVRHAVFDEPAASHFIAVSATVSSRFSLHSSSFQTSRALRSIQFWLLKRDISSYHKTRNISSHFILFSMTQVTKRFTHKISNHEQTLNSPIPYHRISFHETL